MRGQVFVAVAALATAFTAMVPAASAQQYSSYHDAHVANEYQCQTSRNNRTAGGAVIGGILGAVLGSNVAANGHRGDGTALGAAVGAVAGGAIGRNTARCDQVPQGSYDPYTGRPYQQDGYYQNDDDLYGGPYQESGYYGDDRYGRECRMGEIITRDRRGREYREEAMLCRGSDGVWRPE